MNPAFKENFGALGVYLKHGTFLKRPYCRETFFSSRDRLVIRNDSGEIQIEMDSILHLALNLLKAAREYGPACSKLSGFASEAQRLAEDVLNREKGCGVYFLNPGANFLFRAKDLYFNHPPTDVIPFEKTDNPPLSAVEKEAKFLHEVKVLYDTGNYLALSKHLGCPQGLPDYDEDIAGETCGMCGFPRTGHKPASGVNPDFIFP
jgi:hypothetical protein